MNMVLLFFVAFVSSWFTFLKPSLRESLLCDRLFPALLN
jgi:hypothetical protein